MIHRVLISDIQQSMFKGDIIILIGARQVGKTTLIQTLLTNISEKNIIHFNGDYLADQRAMQVYSKQDVEAVFGKYQYIVIDEAQKIDNIGNILKILIDLYGKTKQILVTGSSTLHLIDQTSEPLTGRKKVYELYPIAFSELVITFGERDARARLEEILLYGSYPQVLSLVDYSDKKSKLQDIVSGQLYRDILEFQSIRNPDILTKLLELLALQLGSEISYHTLAQTLGVSQQTVERYIDLLEKSFVIFRLRPYATNKIKEITKMKKIYFYDLGIRNTIISAFQPIGLRTDMGAIWENFFILECRKKMMYHTRGGKQYFWRTKMQEEVDLIESYDGQYFAYECKWGQQSYRPPMAFVKAYPDITVELATRENYYQLLR